MADIVGSNDYMNSTYVDYQEKYRKDIRESDKVLINLLKETLTNSNEESILDIGCHTGNFLFHLKKLFPNTQMTGGDLFEGVINKCISDQDLKNINFEVMDIRKINKGPFDIIIANAVLSRFSKEVHNRIWEGFYSSLKPNGKVLTFDWYNPFNQDLHIIEETESHPNGLILNFYSQKFIKTSLLNIGYKNLEFKPFNIPIDLSLKDKTDPYFSYTVKSSNGENLLFRGTLHQPWCHLIVEK